MVSYYDNVYMKTDNIQVKFSIGNFQEEYAKEDRIILCVYDDKEQSFQMVFYYTERQFQKSKQDNNVRSADIIKL